MITVNKTEFLNGIKAVKSSCGKGELNPILNTINLKTVGQGIQLTATDCTNSARTTIEANVTEQVDICVNSDKLENIVNALDDIITIELDKVVATIKSGKTHFDIVVLLSEDFPQPKFDLPEEKITLSKDDFVKCINKTVIATATEVQNILNGICFTFTDKGYEMAATDGNRLSQVKFDEVVGKQGQYVIPHNVLSNVAKSVQDNIEIYFEDNRAIFKTGSYLYCTNLYNGTYPKYQQLIPVNQPNVAKIKRTHLLKSLEKVAIMSDSRTNITVFNFKDNELFLTTSCDGGKAEDTIEIDFGAELKMAFNFRFILEGIKAMQSEYVEFEMSTDKGACLLNGDFIYLVMPIVVKE
jgi:DNA polymerase-3 subunit beta